MGLVQEQVGCCSWLWCCSTWVNSFELIVLGGFFNNIWLISPYIYIWFNHLSIIYDVFQKHLVSKIDSSRLVFPRDSRAVLKHHLVWRLRDCIKGFISTCQSVNTQGMFQPTHIPTFGWFNSSPPVFLSIDMETAPFVDHFPRSNCQGANAILAVSMAVCRAGASASVGTWLQTLRHVEPSILIGDFRPFLDTNGVRNCCRWHAALPIHREDRGETNRQV